MYRSKKVFSDGKGGWVVVVASYLSILRRFVSWVGIRNASYDVSKFDRSGIKKNSTLKYFQFYIFKDSYI